MPSRVYFYHCKGKSKGGHPCPWICDWSSEKRGDVPKRCIRGPNRKAGDKPKWILDRQEIDYRE